MSSMGVGEEWFSTETFGRPTCELYTSRRREMTRRIEKQLTYRRRWCRLEAGNGRGVNWGLLEIGIEAVRHSRTG